MFLLKEEEEEEEEEDDEQGGKSVFGRKYPYMESCALHMALFHPT